MKQWYIPEDVRKALRDVINSSTVELWNWVSRISKPTTAPSDAATMTEWRCRYHSLETLRKRPTICHPSETLVMRIALASYRSVPLPHKQIMILRSRMTLRCRSDWLPYAPDNPCIYHVALWFLAVQEPSDPEASYRGILCLELNLGSSIHRSQSGTIWLILGSSRTRNRPRHGLCLESRAGVFYTTQLITKK